MTELAICTIITKSHLVYARTLWKSISQYHPDLKLYVLLADTVDNYFKPNQEPFHWIYLSDLSDQQRIQQMCFYYTPFELCCALRGMLHEYIYENTNLDYWLFLDSDLMVFAPLDDIFKQLESHSILLTAHSQTPLIDSQYIDYHEYNFLISGLYNAGFLGLKRCEPTYKFINWFKERLIYYSFNDHNLGEPRGLFVDQLWLNLVPQFFEQVGIVSHPGANIGHWNLWERNLAKEQNGQIMADGKPLLFVHFSGWDIDNPDQVSLHNPMYEGKSIPIWQQLAQIYRQSLLDNGYETTINYPYKYATFKTGETIKVEQRRLYYDALKKGQNIEKSPFLSYTDFYFNFMNNYTESNQSQSIPPEKLPGINVAGFLRSELGIGEVARGYITAMESLNCDVNLQDLSQYLQSRKEDRTFTNFSEHNPHEVNLICVNADFVPIFIDTFGTQYLENKYNIACWYWELPEFPAKWWQYFQHFQEIWVGSKYVYESLIKHSPIPVVKISPVVGFKLNKTYNKHDFGLDNNEFVFLFMFDFLSIFERKNPLALVEAFLKSFQPDEPVRLVLKCINGDKDPKNFDLLKQAIVGHRITLMDDYLSKDAKNGLLSICDCYISLHRAEGFGLTLAEAMFLEKPVIATGWSGNMDFMNINNSYPVKYKLTALKQDYGPYNKGQIWAEPDIAHAAQLMRQVYDNPQEAKSLAQQAAEDIRKLHSPLITSKQIQARMQTISQSKIYQWKEELKQHLQIQTELEETQHQLQTSQDMVTAMTTSKFWRIRKGWFKLKGLFGLNKDEQII